MEYRVTQNEGNRAEIKTTAKEEVKK